MHLQGAPTGHPRALPRLPVRISRMFLTGTGINARFSAPRPGTSSRSVHPCRRCLPGSCLQSRQGRWGLTTGVWEPESCVSAPDAAQEPRDRRSLWRQLRLRSPSSSTSPSSSSGRRRSSSRVLASGAWCSPSPPSSAASRSRRAICCERGTCLGRSSAPPPPLATTYYWTHPTYPPSPSLTLSC